MNKIKITTNSYLLVLFIINVMILPYTNAGGLIDMGYGRGIATDHSDEPIQPIPVSFDPDNAKTELGKKLFFEPRLSKSGWISCNSCHNLSAGGTDNLPGSIGHKWQNINWD